TATASALAGTIADPRSLDMPYPRIAEPAQMVVNRDVFVPPLPLAEARLKPLQKTDNTPALPELTVLPDTLEIPVLLVTGDNVSTDDIMPAGQRVMPYWSSVYASAP
ncbi:aconitate hydratase, partial [Halomonas sp. MCCC 1A11081]|nr:aconitate hydratase [Halomonas ethanolica]